MGRRFVLAGRKLALEPIGVDTRAARPELNVSLAWLRKDLIYMLVKKIYMCFTNNIRGHARTLNSQVAVTWPFHFKRSVV